MITKDIIRAIYHQYPRRAKSPDYLDFALLFDSVGALHNISINPEATHIVIGSIDPHALFHRIPLGHIHAFVPFDEWTAILLDTSIIFLNRRDSQVSINLRPDDRSLLNRLKEFINS